MDRSMQEETKEKRIFKIISESSQKRAGHPGRNQKIKS